MRQTSLDSGPHSAPPTGLRGRAIPHSDGMVSMEEGVVFEEEISPLPEPLDFVLVMGSFSHRDEDIYSDFLKDHFMGPILESEPYTICVSQVHACLPDFFVLALLFVMGLVAQALIFVEKRHWGQSVIAQHQL
jgi:hypothetical protein